MVLFETIDNFYLLGFSPIVVENKLNGDEIQTDLDLLRQTIVQTGPENILAVMSTTSCFAPRAYDKYE